MNRRHLVHRMQPVASKTTSNPSSSATGYINELHDVAKNVKVLKSKAVPSSTKDTTPGEQDLRTVHEALTSDDFLRSETGLEDYYAKVKKILENKKTSRSSGSASWAAVREAQVGEGQKSFEEPGSVWSLLKEQGSAPDVDQLRVRRPYMTARMPRQIDFEAYEKVETYGNFGGFRAANPSTRRSPTTSADRIYITIDTACENTSFATSITSSLWWSRRMSSTVLDLASRHRPSSVSLFQLASEANQRSFALR